MWSIHRGLLRPTGHLLPAAHSQPSDRSPASWLDTRTKQRKGLWLPWEQRVGRGHAIFDSQLALGNPCLSEGRPRMWCLSHRRSLPGSPRLERRAPKDAGGAPFTNDWLIHRFRLTPEKLALLLRFICPLHLLTYLLTFRKMHFLKTVSRIPTKGQSIYLSLFWQPCFITGIPPLIPSRVLV